MHEICYTNKGGLDLTLLILEGQISVYPSNTGCYGDLQIIHLVPRGLPVGVLDEVMFWAAHRKTTILSLELFFLIF